MNKILLFFFLIFSLQTNAALRVLTYSSMLDKGGLGETLARSAKEKNIPIEFISSKDFSGMLGTLRRLQREKKQSIDIVLGLNESNYQSALQEKLISEGKVFEEATFSVLVNKKTFPEKDWPRSWNEVKTKLAGKLLVQDPRTSEVGLNWLLNATTLRNLSLEDAKKIPKKIFSTWSASFEAFEAGMAPAIWTYSTSAAFYRCSNNKDAENFVNLPLPLYPKDKNFVAAVARSGVQTSAQQQIASSKANKFIELLLSEEIQKHIWQKNWMFPVNSLEKKQEMPPCFAGIWFPRDAQAVGSLEAKELLKRLDQWSL